MVLYINGVKQGGGGGVSSLQEAYNGGSDISLNSSRVITIHGSGIPYGNNNLASLLTEQGNQLLANAAIGNPTVNAPITAGLVRILGDTAITFPASDRVDFGIDLTTLPIPVAVSSITTNIVNSSIVLIKDANVSADEKSYVIIGLANGATTNSIAILVDISTGLPATLTSTTGTATISNQLYAFSPLGATSNGPQNIILGLQGEGDGTQPLLGLISDNGNYKELKALYNVGNLTDSILTLANFSPLVGTIADVPYIKMFSIGGVPNSGDIQFNNARTADPTGLGIVDSGTVHYNSSSGRLKLWDGSAFNELAYLTDIGSTLDDSYDFGGAGAGRFIVADAGAVEIDDPSGSTTVFKIVDTSGAPDDRILLSGAGNITILTPNLGTSLNLSNLGTEGAHISFGGIVTDPSTPAQGDFWYNEGASNRLRFHDGIATRNLALEVGTTSLTAGSVIFANSDGYLIQNNSNLFWDNTNNRLGIGTATPSEKLEVAGRVLLKAGASTDRGIVSGTLLIDPTSINSSTVETDLMSKTILGDTLNTNGEYIAFEGAGTFANNANSKRLRVYFDGNVIFDTGSLALQNSTWVVRGKIIALSSSNIKTIVDFIADDSALRTSATINSSLTVDLTSDRVLKFTGVGGAAADIVQQFLEVEWKKPYNVIVP